VLAEIDAALGLDPVEIDRLATPRTKAVMVLHYQGVAARIDAILERAQRRGLKVIEDCAQAPGVSFGGRRIGTRVTSASSACSTTSPCPPGKAGCS
jgi:dTDP-4-amino-4,6-dideoxygalactose transaminase